MDLTKESCQRRLEELVRMKQQCDVQLQQAMTQVENLQAQSNRLAGAIEQKALDVQQLSGTESTANAVPPKPDLKIQDPPAEPEEPDEEPDEAADN